MMEQPYNEGDLARELFFINCLLNSNGKEYQLWTYKKRLIQHFKTNLTNFDAIYSSEEDFLEYLLEEDSKNYHVWDYKLWLTLEFGKEEHQITRSSTLLF
jgi:protein farnesyltransferase/geranylgeranyltransferase type-1 subunit alpha